MKILKTNINGKEMDVEIKKGRYTNTGSLALGLYDNETKEPLCVVTVNLDILLPNYAYLDTNNNPWITDVLNEYGKNIGRDKQSGFYSYPLWKFDSKFIEECEEM